LLSKVANFVNSYAVQKLVKNGNGIFKKVPNYILKWIPDFKTDNLRLMTFPVLLRKILKIIFANLFSLFLK